MDLVKIGFLIKADGLVKANKEIDALLAKADKLNNLGGAGGGTGSGSGGKQRNQNKPAKEIDKTTKALEKQKIIGDYVSQGLDKSTATTLANFKQLGASTKDLNKMFAQLGNIKSLEQANKAVKDLAKAQKQAQKDIEKQEKALESTRQKRLSAEQKEYQKTQEDAKKLQQKQQDLANKAQQNADNLRQKTLAADQKYYQKVQEEARKAAAKQQELSDKNVAKAEAARQKSLSSAQKEYQKNMELVQKQQQAQRAAQQKADEAQEKARQKKFSADQKYYQQQQELAAKAARTQQDSINRQNQQRQNAVKQEETKAKYLGQGFSQTASTRLARMELSGADVATMERYKQALRDTAKAMNDMRPPAAAATEGNNRLLASIRGIAAYALLSTAIYGVITGVAALAKAMVTMSDEYTSIQNRMKLYITDAQELTDVNAKLAQFSIANNVGLRETATLFTRLAPAMQKIGANTAAVTSVVDAFGKSLRIGGATAQEAASATIQFSQAMASGKLAGDEFRSISEASPRFLKAIADGSGIAAEKLKEMSSAGMLTTEVISKALLKEYPKLIEENKKLGVTLEQGANAIKTGFLVAIGEFNEGAGITKALGESMANLAQSMFTAAQGAREFGQDVKQWFTDNAGTINLVVEAFKILATVITSRYVVAMGLAVRESIRYQATLVTMAAQQANVTRSSLIMSSAITSVGAAMRGALAFFGGWVGLALTVASATVAYLSFNSASGATAESFRQEGEALTTTIAKYKELAKVKQQAILDKEIANLEELNKQYDENKAKLVTNVLNLSRHNDMTKAQAKSMSALALSYKNGDISLEQLVSTVSKSGYVSNDSKVKTRGFAEAVIDAGEKAGLSKDLINAMRKALADSGETAKISKTGVDTFTKGLEDQAKKLRETTALARKYGLEIASAAKLQEQLSSRFGARETELPLKKQYYDKKAQAAMARGDTAIANNWTKASLGVQSQQNSLLKEKNQVIGQTIKGLKEVELAQKEQSDYTESLRKAEKGSEKVGNTREKDRKKYQDQAKELSTYITLLKEAQDVDIARISSEKEYQNAFGASLDQAKALYELRRQSEQVEARAVFVKNLAEEEEAQGRLVALMKAGLDIATARTLVEAKFTDNAKGKEAAEKYLTNMAYEQHYALADQIDSQGVMNNLLKQGYTIEQASFRLMTSRIRTLNGDSTYLDDLDKAYDAQVKQLKARQAESFVLQETDKLEKQKVAYINAQAVGYEKLALNMAIANKIAQNPDLSPDQAKRLVEAEELTNYEKELADLKAKTYITTLKESDAVKDIISNYATWDSVQVGAYDRQQKLLGIAKELSDEAEKQRKNPIGDFSSVDFNVFGDFGNPFESALAGLNEFVAKSTESRNILASIEKDIVAAKEQGLSVNDLELERNIVLANQEKDRKKSIDKGITTSLALTKSLFKEESKGYKVVSGLEKAYQASKIAFALWEKKDTIKTMAIKLAGYAKDMAMFIGGIATKITAQMGLNVVQAQGAVASAAQAPPPVGFASAAAMIALMAGIGIAISGGGSSGGEYVDTSNQGTGTVFGDSEAQSASIANSIDLLSENSDLMLPLTSAMLRSLRNIESSIGGVTNLILRGDLGGDFSNLEFDGRLTGTLSKMDGVIKGVEGFVDKISIGKMLGFDIRGVVSGLGSTIIGGLFGKTSQSVTASGLYAGKQKLGSILENGINLKQYADVTTTKKSWFSSSSSSSTSYADVDKELKNQFTLIFGGFYDSILSATDILGADLSTVENNLKNAVVSIGKINLKGLSGEEIQEKLEAVFGAAADDLAKQAFGGLEDFQSVGEGYYETLVKVASAVEEAAYYTDRLNVTAINYTAIINKQADDLATEIIRQSYLTKVGISTIKGGMTDLVNTFDGSAEEITNFINTLEDLQDQLFMTGKNADYLTSSMILGAGGLDSLASGLDAYFEMLSPAEQAAELTRRLTNEFAIFGKQLPSDVKAFRNLVSSIDISSEAGQKLYGQILALAPEFNDLQDALSSANSDVNALVQSLRDLAEQARAARGETEQPRNLAYTRSQFEQASVLAMQGDVASAEKLLTLGNDLMGLSKSYSVTGSEYARDLALIQRAATVSADIQEQGLGTSISTTLTPSSGSTTTPTVNTNTTSTDAKLDALREDLNAALLAIAKYTQTAATKLENWDDGDRMTVRIEQYGSNDKIPVSTA